MHSQQTIDDLQYQKTQLVKQINEAQRQLTSLDNQIKTLTQITSESPRIQAFVDSYKGLTYNYGTFYYRPNESFSPIYFNYDYPSKAISLDKAIDDMERYITNPRSQGGPRFQSGEELANSVGKINAYHSL